MRGTCMLTATGLYSCEFLSSSTASLVAVAEAMALRQLVWLSMWAMWPVALFLILMIWGRFR